MVTNDKRGEERRRRHQQIIIRMRKYFYWQNYSKIINVSLILFQLYLHCSALSLSLSVIEFHFISQLKMNFISFHIFIKKFFGSYCHSFPSNLTNSQNGIRIMRTFVKWKTRRKCGKSLFSYLGHENLWKIRT